MSHAYNTRNNSSSPNTAENESVNIGMILSLEKKLLSCFDRVDKELLNLKDVIIKNLQIENQHLRSKVNFLENKVIHLEINSNHLEQYGRRNNLEIT